MDYKKCSHCGQIKSLSLFTVDLRYKLGVKSTCDECRYNIKCKTEKFKGCQKDKWDKINRQRRVRRLITESKELLKRQGFDITEDTLSLKTQQLSTYRVLKKIKKYVKEKTASTSK